MAKKDGTPAPASTAAANAAGGNETGGAPEKAATAASTPARRSYTVRSPILFGRAGEKDGEGKKVPARRYEVGETIKLTEAEAAALPAHAVEAPAKAEKPKEGG